MAHFAKLDENNQVTEVVAVNNDVLQNLPFPDSEPIGVAFLESLFGPGVWKQTSYNNNFRGNYAGLSMTYDTENDIFIRPKPFPSWVLNKQTASWNAPVSKPDGKSYTWNEETLSWDYVPPPPTPFPSWKLDENDIWQPPVPRPTDGQAYRWDEATQTWIVRTV